MREKTSDYTSLQYKMITNGNFIINKNILKKIDYSKSGEGVWK